MLPPTRPIIWMGLHIEQAGLIGTAIRCGVLAVVGSVAPAIICDSPDQQQQQQQKATHAPS